MIRRELNLYINKYINKLVNDVRLWWIKIKWTYRSLATQQPGSKQIWFENMIRRELNACIKKYINELVRFWWLWGYIVHWKASSKDLSSFGL